MRKRNLLRLLSVPVLALALSGCPGSIAPKENKTEISFDNTWLREDLVRKFNNYQDTNCDRIAKREDTYLGYASELQKLPMFKDEQRDSLAECLRILNRGDLKKGKCVIFPEY